MGLQPVSVYIFLLEHALLPNGGSIYLEIIMNINVVTGMSLSVGKRKIMKALIVGWYIYSNAYPVNPHTMRRKRPMVNIT